VDTCGDVSVGGAAISASIGHGRATRCATSPRESVSRYAEIHVLDVVVVVMDEGIVPVVEEVEACNSAKEAVDTNAITAYHRIYIILIRGRAQILFGHLLQTPRKH